MSSLLRDLLLASVLSFSILIGIARGTVGSFLMAKRVRPRQCSYVATKPLSSGLAERSREATRGSRVISLPLLALTPAPLMVSTLLAPPFSILRPPLTLEFLLGWHRTIRRTILLTGTLREEVRRRTLGIGAESRSMSPKIIQRSFKSRGWRQEGYATGTLPAWK